MKRTNLPIWPLALLLPLLAGVAFAQPKAPATPVERLRIPAARGAAAPAATPNPTPPPATPATPEARHGDTTSLPQFPDEIEFQPRPDGYRVAFSLEDANLSELVRVISQLTGRRFIFGGKVRDIKATVYSPQKVTVAEAYRAFLAILETNGLTVVPHGQFLKIIESPGVVNQTTPIFGTGQPVPQEERYITRLYRLNHISADEVAKLLVKFKSKEADISTYPPGGLLIITDTGSNVRRLLRIVEEIDVGGASNQIWVENIHYAVASELATKLGEIFDISGKGQPTDAVDASDTRISKIMAEDRTNSLIIVATESAYLRVLELIKRLDVQQTGDGDIHVLALQHAMAEELAQTLNNILSGMTSTSGAKAARPAGAPGGEGVFEGTLRITADKATNSLVITSSLRDYASIRTVIDMLDRPRRQVFIEAVILDVSVDHTNQFNINYHGGAAPNVGGGGDSLVYGGFNPLTSILLPSADNLQGLALGVRGPDIDGTTNLLGTGLTVPAFGVVVNALATSSDANVLATPHIIATDNVPAEISVGQNIPLQTNLGGLGSMGSLAGLAGGQAGSAASSLGALSSFGFGGFAAPRQDVGTKIKVVPHINDSNEVRLELTEEISEQGAASGALGVVSITKRTAETTVVVRDQQTVVIGGLMRDAVVSSESKVPVLGDLPLLGFLFRNSSNTKQKTNLLLILTPYIIRDQDDLRAIFERKMQERQEFLDRYFVFSDQKPYEPPKDFSRANGLVETIRQAQFQVQERKRLLEESRPDAAKQHEPGVPIEWVPSSSGGGEQVARDPTSPPPAPHAPPAGGPPNRTRVAPIRVTPPAKNVESPPNPEPR
ncbi:MAG TPA: type II secretion system secretin GspD [Polyangiaceae bacterium]|jgi:general secretion pathway protein D|nr:MAG: putative type II secretion system protein D precursor [Deltaproteobacteria bacterium ADurb.Bin207]HNS99627.1 type II secretion system secretin GspD [Polyangiaceae bacterium]HNZ21989.1 type II secretion system secretin GspD [Polyangiaceae bacterium]HOD23173.1 type II secretion system secretin GspD [Polyangiaceae bacterium]HOE47297.1 type II secretion system secretin GspD [Polyangiaceae bacterium]